MIPAKTDPHISCPIVCGEYMRATGFFLTTNNRTYLITARHNLLPTNARELDTGEQQLTYHTHDLLPTIDIYLRDTPSFTVKRLHLFEKQGILIDKAIDVIGIPIDIDPEEYGYVPWTLNDITTPDASPATLDIIGYPSRSFPNTDEYDTTTYTQQITGPYVLTLLNDFQTHQQTPTNTGHLTIGIDRSPQKSDVAYDGYSGCPVLGDGLVGIHCANLSATAVHTDTPEKTETTAIAYWRADAVHQFFP